MEKQKNRVEEHKNTANRVQFRGQTPPEWHLPPSLPPSCLFLLEMPWHAMIQSVLWFTPPPTIQMCKLLGMSSNLKSATYQYPCIFSGHPSTLATPLILWWGSRLEQAHCSQVSLIVWHTLIVSTQSYEVYTIYISYGDLTDKLLRGSTPFSTNESVNLSSMLSKLSLITCSNWIMIMAGRCHAQRMTFLTSD